jgi:hypothetical protein
MVDDGFAANDDIPDTMDVKQPEQLLNVGRKVLTCHPTACFAERQRSRRERRVGSYHTRDLEAPWRFGAAHRA